jgi:hypothetical protein
MQRFTKGNEGSPQSRGTRWGPPNDPSPNRCTVAHRFNQTTEMEAKMKVREESEYEVEQKMIANIQRQWHVRIAHLGHPYYGGFCFVGPDKSILAWMRVFLIRDPAADLTMDIREFEESMPFVWAIGKPLIFVAAFPYGLRYAVSQPGTADFRPYYPDPEEGQTPYDIYWDAVIPAAELKPLGRTLPEALSKNLSVRKTPASAGAGLTPNKPVSAIPVVRAPRRAKQKASRWPDIIPERKNS